MCEELADRAKEKVGDFDAAIERFRNILSDCLKFSRDNEGKRRPQEEIDIEKSSGRNYLSETYYFNSGLHTDYGPDLILSQAAEKAGIDDRLFSIKSNVWIDKNYVSCRFGYGADTDYHYLLPDGRWLITKLLGSDISKVFDYVMGGKPEFVVELAK